MSHSLFDEFLAPVVSPEQYQPARGVVRFATAVGQPIVAEVLKRESGTFGYRFAAWVAWRDAGGEVRSHSWHEVVQVTGIVSNVEDAQSLTAAYAISKGVELEEWRASA